MYVLIYVAVVALKLTLEDIRCRATPKEENIRKFFMCGFAIEKVRILSDFSHSLDQLTHTHPHISHTSSI